MLQSPINYGEGKRGWQLVAKVQSGDSQVHPDKWDLEPGTNVVQ